MLNSTSLTIFLVCVFILIESSKPVQAQEFLQNDEKIDKELALMNEILKNYDKTRKPPGQVDIRFALNLNQILMVRAKDQIFEMNTFLDQEWIDPRLSWGNLFCIFEKISQSIKLFFYLRSKSKL